MLVGCTATAAPTTNVPGSSDVWEGSFSYGFETVSFKPCGLAEQWWVTGDALQNLTQQYSQLTSKEYEPVYVRLRGKASELRTYGHLGAYAREFQVAQVLEARARRAGDCE